MENHEFAERLVAVEERSKSNSHRLDALEKQNEIINRLATSMEVMAHEQKNMGDQLSEVVDDVKELKAEPAKKWRFVIEKVLYIIISAVLGFVFAQFKR